MFFENSSILSTPGYIYLVDLPGRSFATWWTRANKVLTDPDLFLGCAPVRLTGCFNSNPNRVLLSGRSPHSKSCPVADRCGHGGPCQTEDRTPAVRAVRESSVSETPSKTEPNRNPTRFSILGPDGLDTYQTPTDGRGNESTGWQLE